MAATATAPGYSAIPPSAMPAPAPAPAPAPGPASAPAPAAKRALDTVLEALAAPSRAPSLYLEPLDPRADIAPRDRVALALESARSWTEFCAVEAARVPAAGMAKMRVVGNVEAFFWNYVMVAVGVAAGLGLFRLGVAAEIVGVGLVAYGAFVVMPEEVVVGSVVLGRRVKMGVVGALAGLVLVFGGGAGFLLSLAVVAGLLVLAHAFMYDLEAVVGGSDTV